jgi:hypothetical protein
MLGLILLGCGPTARRRTTDPAGITLDCRDVVREKYGVEPPSHDNPAFGAVTTTFIIDGRRYHYGVQGFRAR